MTELSRTWEGTVLKEQIDHLGHMNVRYYATKAMKATRTLASEYGLSSEACREHGALLCVQDAFTRYYREQLEGAHLAIMTGVLAVRERSLKLHHELVNRDNGELAATFVHDVQLCDTETRAPRPFPAGLAERAQASTVAWPDHGRPRTVDLERRPSQLTLEVARNRGLEMRQPRTIEAAECDKDGFYEESSAPALVWGGEPISRRGFTPLHETEDGRTFGWAMLEMREVMARPPRVGDRIQSFSAEVQIARKTSYRHSWVFDLDSAELVCASSTVNLAFDIGARKAIEIPAKVRAQLESEYHPDLV